MTQAINSYRGSRPSRTVMSNTKIVRNASGLVRAVGKFDALMMCVAAISIGVGQAFMSDYVQTVSPGVDLVLWLILGLFICLPSAVFYGQLGAAVARSGGDYIFVSRNSWPWLGFAMNWTFTIGAALFLGSMQIWNSTLVVSGTLWALGLSTKNPTMTQWAQIAVLPTNIFIIGAVVLFAVLLVMLLPHRAVLRVNNVMIILGSIGVVLVSAIAFMTSPEAFKASWDSVVGGMGYIKYGEVVPSAQQGGLVMGTGLNPTLFILLLPFLMYFGYQVSNFFSGEMEDVGKSAPLSSIGALLFCVVANILPAAAITHMVGQEWWTSASYLIVSGRAAGAAPPFNAYSSFLASIAVSQNVWLVAVINFLWSMWAFSLWLAYFYFISRCFFAHAFDRVLPIKMAHVTSRTHAPSVALVITWAIAMLGLALSIYTPLFVQFNFSLVIVWMMAIAAAVGIVFPFISKDRFEATPTVARIKIGSVPVFSVVSAITLAVCIAMTAEFLVSPAAYGAISVGSSGIHPSTLPVRRGDLFRRTMVPSKEGRG